MNRNETAKIVFLLSASLQNRNATVGDTDAMVSGWHLVLADCPYDAALAAAREWLRTERWFPAPADIDGLVRRAALGAPEPWAAWEQAMVRPEGGRHPLVRQALKAVGGAYTLGQSSRLDKDRDAFLAAYAEATAAARRTVFDPAPADADRIERPRVVALNPGVAS